MYGSYCWLLYLVLAVLKKNYTRLCNCLSQDYMMTLNKLKQTVTLPDSILSIIISLPTVNAINEAIISTVMAAIKTDMGALFFCDVMEKIVDSKSSKAYVQLLRKGNSCEINTSICSHHLGTIATYTVQLNLNLSFTCVSHESCSTILLSHLQVTHKRMIQYHNLILDACKWCTHEVYYSQATYCTLRTCKLHMWSPLYQSSTNTPGCIQYTDFARAWILSVWTIQLPCQLQPVFSSFVTTVPK